MKPLILIVLAACAEDVAISNADYDTIAQSVGASTTLAGGGGDLGAMTDSLLLAFGDLPLGFTGDASGSAHGSHLGLDYSYSLTCRDITGDLMAACNPSADLADVMLSWDGMLSLATTTTKVAREGRWSLAFLRSPTIKLAGTGSFTYDLQLDAHAFHFDYAAAYTAVMIDKQSQRVLSGALHYAIDARRDLERAFSVDADVTLDGDGTAAIVIDGSHAYTLDLATGLVTGV
jgi:hypothetical protein